MNIEDFLAFISSDLLPYKKRFLETWESEALHNSTQNNMKMKIKREDVLWRLLILKLESSNNQYDEKMQIEEEDFYNALSRYEQIINYKEANFKIYNKISYLIVKAQKIEPHIDSNKFITIYENEIYDIIFEDNKNIDAETIERACSKIIAKRIFIRKRSLAEMFERAKKYEN